MSVGDESGRRAGVASPEQQQPALDNTETVSKREQIQQACEHRDTYRLVQLADSSGGLIDDGLRQLACKTLSANLRL